MPPQILLSKFGRDVFDKQGGPANLKPVILGFFHCTTVLHQQKILGDLVNADARVQVVAWRVLGVSQFLDVFAVFGQDGKLVVVVLLHSVKPLGNFVQSECRVRKHLLVGEKNPELVLADEGSSHRMSVWRIFRGIDAGVLRMGRFVVIDERGLEITFRHGLLYAVDSANDAERHEEHVADGGDIVVAVNGRNIDRFQWEASGVKGGVHSVNVVHCFGKVFCSKVFVLKELIMFEIYAFIIFAKKEFNFKGNQGSL